MLSIENRCSEMPVCDWERMRIVSGTSEGMCNVNKTWLRNGDGNEPFGTEGSGIKKDIPAHRHIAST